MTAANGPRLPGQLAGTIRRSTADGRGELDETDVWPQQNIDSVEFTTSWRRTGAACDRCGDL
ncbi:MAG TPA: hypothetical protein VJ757_09275 [Pseudonocardiaceae bacterium]|nr:hypothetical protein [Pseudonocardiaceae bacterium]